MLEAALELGLSGSCSCSWTGIVAGVEEWGFESKNDQNEFLPCKTCGIDGSLVRAPRVLAPPEGEAPRARGVRLIVGRFQTAQVQQLKPTPPISRPATVRERAPEALRKRAA